MNHPGDIYGSHRKKSMQTPRYGEYAASVTDNGCLQGIHLPWAVSRVGWRRQSGQSAVFERLPTLFSLYMPSHSR